MSKIDQPSTSPKKEPDTLSFEIQTFQEITDEAIVVIARFLKTQKDSALHSKNEEEMYLVVNAASVFKLLRQPNCLQKSILNVAMDGNKVVGISFIVITDTNEVVSTFTGVLPAYQGKGCATQLLRARHSELRNRGIQSYSSSAWEAPGKILEKVSKKVVADKKSDQKTVYL